MERVSERDKVRKWRTSARVILCTGAFLICLGVEALFIALRSGDPATVSNPAVQTAYWVIGFALAAAVALIVRRLLPLQHRLERD